MRGVLTRVLVLLLACAVSIVFVLYNHNLVERLQEQNRTSNETIAWFWAGTQVPFSIVLLQNRLAVCSSCGASVLTPRSRSTSFRMFCSGCDSVTVWLTVDRWTPEERSLLERQTQELFAQLVSRLDYETVLSDFLGTPQVINGASLPDSMPPEQLKKIREVMVELDAENDPIPLTTAAGDTLGWLHYGGSSLETEFRYVPYIELGLLLSLALVLLLGVRGEVRRERGMAWVSFAKETAHQLGTPLSSLLGWLEVLKDRPDLAEDEEIEEAIVSMERDVSRLHQIAERYGELGKKPSLVPTSVNDVVSDIVDYFRSRPGLVPADVRIETKLNATTIVLLNVVLFGWVLENIIKNSLTALANTTSGLITISTRNVTEKPGGIELQLTDNGSGIPFSSQKKIFNAGFSTRRGGWGLGLTLSRRIIEQYHGGSIRLVFSSPDKGSTFVITVPELAAESEREGKAT